MIHFAAEQKYNTVKQLCVCSVMAVMSDSAILWTLDFSVPGELQARTLEWVAIPFSSKVTILQEKLILKN